MAGIVIRTADRDDLTSILALYRHLHPADPEVDFATAEPAWGRLLTSGLTSVILADVAGFVAASCTLAIIPNLSRGARPYGVIENVVTDPDYRRRGLGRSVLKAALDAAWDAGCYKVMLATGSQNEATLRFYEGAGFSKGHKTHFEVRRR